MSNNHRAKRVEESIREAVAQAILMELKDPRVPTIFNITGCRATPDLQLARLYFSQLPDDDDSIDQTIEVLENAEGFLRSRISRAVRLRTAPRLEFFFDDSLQHASRIDSLLREARASSPSPSDPKEKREED